MNNVAEAIISWAKRTDMETITVGMLQDWVSEMALEEQINKQVFQAENHDTSDILVLKLAYSNMTDTYVKKLLSKVITKMEDKNIENI